MVLDSTINILNKVVNYLTNKNYNSNHNMVLSIVVVASTTVVAILLTISFVHMVTTSTSSTSTSTSRFFTIMTSCEAFRISPQPRTLSRQQKDQRRTNTVPIFLKSVLLKQQQQQQQQQHQMPMHLNQFQMKTSSCSIEKDEEMENAVLVQKQLSKSIITSDVTDTTTIISTTKEKCLPSQSGLTQQERVQEQQQFDHEQQQYDKEKHYEQQQQQPQQQPDPQHIVLIGGGHAHVQLLKAFHSGQRPNHWIVTLIDTYSTASYSGMIPGCISGIYNVHQTQIHLQSLCSWSNITFHIGSVQDIDFQKKIVYYDQNHNNCTINSDSTTGSSSSNSIPFDVVSIDIGSTSRDLYSIPGASIYTIPTRPIHKMLQILQTKQSLDAQMYKNENNKKIPYATTKPSNIQSTKTIITADTASLPSILESDVTPISPDCTTTTTTRTMAASPPPPPHLVVVGGGIAGIELAFTVTNRWRQNVHPNTSCTILHRGTEFILPNHHNNDPSIQSTSTTTEKMMQQQQKQQQQQQRFLLKLLNESNIQVQYGTHVHEVHRNFVSVTTTLSKPPHANNFNNNTTTTTTTTTNQNNMDSTQSSVISTSSTIPFDHCIWAAGAGSHQLSQHLYSKRNLACAGGNDDNVAPVGGDGDDDDKDATTKRRMMMNHKKMKNHWILVRDTLQSVSYPYVFAAGDCCSLVSNPHLPKAGVYAVRAGPILIENISRYLQQQQQEDANKKLMYKNSQNSIKNRNNQQRISNHEQNKNNVYIETNKNATNVVVERSKNNSENEDNSNNYNDNDDDLMDNLSNPIPSLMEYVPQSDFMKLLVCGNGRALGFRFGLLFYGKWVLQMKDHIDQNFMNLFDTNLLPPPPQPLQQQKQYADNDSKYNDRQKENGDGNNKNPSLTLQSLTATTTEKNEYNNNNNVNQKNNSLPKFDVTQYDAVVQTFVRKQSTHDEINQQNQQLKNNVTTLKDDSKKIKTMQNIKDTEKPLFIEPWEAARIVHRTDDVVDYLVPWSILRNMGDDTHYCQEVVKASLHLLATEEGKYI